MTDRGAVLRPDRLAHLVRKHPAFGDDGEVEAFGDAGVHLDAAFQVLQRRHRLAEAAVQPFRFGRLRRHPDLLQRCDDAAVTQHRTKQRHGLVDGADAQAGLTEQAAPQRRHRRRLLRHVHLEDRLRLLGAPGAEPFEQLDAAQRQRQRARVARHVLVGRARIEQRDAGFGQRAGGLQRQRQADRAGTDHGNL